MRRAFIIEDSFVTRLQRNPVWLQIRCRDVQYHDVSGGTITIRIVYSWRHWWLFTVAAVVERVQDQQRPKGCSRPLYGICWDCWEMSEDCTVWYGKSTANQCMDIQYHAVSGGNITRL